MKLFISWKYHFRYATFIEHKYRIVITCQSRERRISPPESQKGINAVQLCSIENQKGTNAVQLCSIKNQKGTNAVQLCSIENQKGTNAVQLCSIENQKGINAVQLCSIENQKGINAVQLCSIEIILIPDIPFCRNVYFQSKYKVIVNETFHFLEI